MGGGNAFQHDHSRVGNGCGHARAGLELRSIARPPAAIARGERTARFQRPAPARGGCADRAWGHAGAVRRRRPVAAGNGAGSRTGRGRESQDPQPSRRDLHRRPRARRARSARSDVAGEGAGEWKVGDNIYAMLGIDRGGYAEHAIVKDTEAAAKPSSLDHVTAAAVPLAGLTAWKGLFRHGGLAAGQKVLIHGGAGGVGHFAVQFAKVKGGHVATTVSEKHVQFVRDLGADQIIDYQKQRFEDVVRDVDLVFDLIGGETQTRSWKVLRNGGVLVSTVMEPPAIVAQAHGARGLRYRVQESGLELGEIGRLIDAGKVKPTVSKRFALAQAVEAQRQLEDGHTEGKIVLAIAA